MTNRLKFRGNFTPLRIASVYDLKESEAVYSIEEVKLNSEASEYNSTKRKSRENNENCNQCKNKFKENFRIRFSNKYFNPVPSEQALIVGLFSHQISTIAGVDCRKCKNTAAQIPHIFFENYLMSIESRNQKKKQMLLIFKIN